MTVYWLMVVDERVRKWLRQLGTIDLTYARLVELSRRQETE